MPNNIQNTIIFQGSKKEIDDFLALFQGRDAYERQKDVTFNHLIPMPREICSDGQAWYDWSLENWGTKWDAYEIEILRSKKSQKEIEEKKLLVPILIEKNLSDNEETVIIKFQTAWDFPKPFIEKIGSKKQTFLHLYCCEGGPEFSGYNFYEKGKLGSSKYYDYENQNHFTPITICKFCWGRELNNED